MFKFSDPVIVAAWIGVIGGVLGGLIGGLMALVAVHFSNRAERQREDRDAQREKLLRLSNTLHELDYVIQVADQRMVLARNAHEHVKPGMLQPGTAEYKEAYREYKENRARVEELAFQAQGLANRLVTSENFELGWEIMEKVFAWTTLLMDQVTNENKSVEEYDTAKSTAAGFTFGSTHTIREQIEGQQQGHKASPLPKTKTGSSKPS